ncbi:uncharacterized protein AKAME5_002981700, partial [Lates japonicus]
MHQVKHRGEHHVSRKPSYADIVQTQRQRDASCVAGPPHTDNVNVGDEPGEKRVRASCSQASIKYGRYRNQQCTCNSLTFLAFLHENENITSTDLDRVLDKGNVLYKQARQMFPQHAHLTTDELPDLVPARSHVLHADKTLLSRYGTLGDPLPGAVNSFLDLEAGLSCLLSDVQYALLLMTGLCIAVFRTRSGRYGFFDPHPRGEDGLPLLRTSVFAGTAVMVTFTRLSDMIDRIKMCHKRFDTQPSCNYELKPVEFESLNTANDSEDIPDPQTLTTTPSPTSVLVDAFPNKSSASAPEINTVQSHQGQTTQRPRSSFAVILPLHSRDHQDCTTLHKLLNYVRWHFCCPGAVFK